MDKTAVVQKIITALQAQLESLKRAAQEAHAAATDPGSKAENKYDTRNLESSYLARGQALRVAEAEEAILAFQSLPSRSHAQCAPGALVVLKFPSGTLEHYFIGPAAGGTEIVCDGREVLVITPSSPVGRQLIGAREGEDVLLGAGAIPTKAILVSLS